MVPIVQNEPCKRACFRFLRLSRTGNVQDPDLVFLDETMQKDASFFVGGCSRQDEEGLAVLSSQFQRLLRSPRKRGIDANDHYCVGIPNIPLSALQVTCAGCFFKFIASINYTVLSFAALGTPTTMRDAVGYRPIQCGPIHTGLTA